MADIFIKRSTVASDYVASAAVDWTYGLDINSGDGSLDGGFGQTVGISNRVNAPTTLTAGGGTQARLVDLPSNSGYALAGGASIGTTKICTYGGCGSADNGRNPEVEVTGGTILSTVNVDIIDDGNPAAPFTYSITPNGVNTNGSWNNLRIFWGTGWCANDTVEGFASVPVPEALPIIGAALAGFGFAGWRQRKAA